MAPEAASMLSFIVVWVDSVPTHAAPTGQLTKLCIVMHASTSACLYNKIVIPELSRFVC